MKYHTSKISSPGIGTITSLNSGICNQPPHHTPPPIPFKYPNKYNNHCIFKINLLTTMKLDFKKSKVRDIYDDVIKANISYYNVQYCLDKYIERLDIFLDFSSSITPLPYISTTLDNKPYFLD